MAGWDLDFEVDSRDLDLVRDCFRLLRRTCARHSVEFSYREWARRGDRVEYLLVFNLKSQSLALAMRDFIVEMRAVSVLAKGARRKRLPLRLARDVSYTAVDEDFEQQLGEAGRLPTVLIRKVAPLLESFEIVYAAYITDALHPAEFLEAAHSLVVQLAFAVSPEARPSDSYPELVEKLTTNLRIRDDLKVLGTRRNAAKHRGKRANAAEYLDEVLPGFYQAVHSLTGAYVDPVSSTVAEIARRPETAFESPPMSWRSGENRSIHR